MNHFAAFFLIFVVISNALPLYPKDPREDAPKPNPNLNLSLNLNPNPNPNLSLNPRREVLQESKDGKFYLLHFTDNHMNWMRAEQLCSANGDQLASIHTKEGNDHAAELCLGADVESKSFIQISNLVFIQNRDRLTKQQQSCLGQENQE